MEKLNTKIGQETYKKAKKLIPGGTSLLSKRPEMFLPEGWPSYYKSAKGVKIRDLDGNTFIDMSIMGVGANILGYADDDVDNAVIKAIKNGQQTSLICEEEVILAQKLVELHPWSSMVRYARGGGEAMSIAIRVARAHTKREKVIISGYHGWTDWYLAANLGDNEALDGHLIPGLEPAGVPRSLKDTTYAFHYNKIEQLKATIKENPNEIAAIVMEPQRSEHPVKKFLDEVRKIADKIGAVLVFDEITTGFRMNIGGIHKNSNVNPDLAIFAKAMANGYAMAAIVGREEIMQSSQDSFISSTNWTERVGPVAALATIKKFEKENVLEHIKTIGNQTMDGWRKISDNSSLKLKVSGLPTLNHFHFEHENELELNTLFTQKMLEQGYMAWNQFKPSYAHTEKIINEYLEVMGEVIKKLSLIKDDKEKILEELVSIPAKRGFYRLTS